MDGGSEPAPQPSVEEENPGASFLPQTYAKIDAKLTSMRASGGIPKNQQLQKLDAMFPLLSKAYLREVGNEGATLRSKAYLREVVVFACDFQRGGGFHEDVCL